ncbi:hypothetical protein Bbelb_061960 [Branchiostoma belcheri]|nr:hypothetical protein Bbelb_061960 [Branchiostoma belcheri]
MEFYAYFFVPTSLYQASGAASRSLVEAIYTPQHGITAASSTSDRTWCVFSLLFLARILPRCSVPSLIIQPCRLLGSEKRRRSKPFFSRKNPLAARFSQHTQCKTRC